MTGEGNGGVVASDGDEGLSPSHGGRLGILWEKRVVFLAVGGETDGWLRILADRRLLVGLSSLVGGVDKVLECDDGQPAVRVALLDAEASNAVAKDASEGSKWPLHEVFVLVFCEDLTFDFATLVEMCVRSPVGIKVDILASRLLKLLFAAATSLGSSIFNRCSPRGVVGEECEFLSVDWDSSNWFV